MQDHLMIRFRYQIKFRYMLMMIVILIWAGLGINGVAAEPFSRMVVFGDGFSDQGNVFLATSRLTPAPPNFDGRLSNGRVWVEQLADRFMLTLTPVLAGGTNYAYIGARVNKDVALSFGQVPSVASQVDMFLATIPPDDPENEIDNEADPKALYVVFGGSQDLFDLVTEVCMGQDGAPIVCPASKAEEIASNLIVAVSKLGVEGAVYFLVPNLPPLARTPRGMALDAESQERLASYVVAFNNLLETGLARLEADLGIIAFRLNTAQTFDEIFLDPFTAEFSNVTDACLVGESLSGGVPCADPDGHLFWDAFLPTTAGHAAIANAAFPGHVHVAGASIQVAVNLAQPGDTVVVPPGLYAGTVVVTQSDLTIHASRQAVLDAIGQTNGLSVGTGAIAPDAQGLPQCPPVSVSNFTLRGLTVRNAQERGISFIGVNTLQVIGGDYLGNGQYGIHLSCSQNGLLHLNTISDHTQSAIFIGNSDSGVVRDNRLMENAIGIEVANATNVTMIENRQISGNTVGIVISAQPGMPVPMTQDIEIVDNSVARNNRPAPEPPGTGVFSALSSGMGIVNFGGDDVIVRQNLVLRNSILGIGILSNPFVASDPRVDPAPDRNQVIENISLQNAVPPPEPVTALIGDLVYDSSGTLNCFANNRTLTTVPDAIASAFPCL